ncbi:hypothetical protein MBH78_14675 [Oceanimonas sp. NS1]|nr:hypothetical protein [Oceanimonas sp. NS1]
MLAREVARRSEKLQLQHQQLIQADKMSSLGILVSGVAHEINNPSSLLLLNLPVLKDAFADLEALLEAQYEQQGDFTWPGCPTAACARSCPPCSMTCRPAPGAFAALWMICATLPVRARRS